ncbi:hypothetical protein HMPREF1870_00139 [Bacteroidales bacterium KA00344]|nr:hypothetical protein HMPREF1870_00139 [Bacteroidales bacterium KA00344]
MREFCLSFERNLSIYFLIYCPRHKGAIENITETIGQHITDNLMSRQFSKKYGQNIIQKLNNSPTMCMEFQNQLNIYKEK